MALVAVEVGSSVCFLGFLKTIESNGAGWRGIECGERARLKCRATHLWGKSYLLIWPRPICWFSCLGLLEYTF